MITTVRSASISPGKIDEGFAFAVEIAHYINENLPGTTVQVLRNIGGKMAQVHWVSTYESLAAYEAYWTKLENDAGFKEKLAEARGNELYVADSIVDSLYQTIS